MRKILASLLLILCPVVALAASGPVVATNEAGLTYSNTYTQNLQAFGAPSASAKNLSVQVNWSTVTYANSTFSDGTQSTGSLTVVSTSTIVATVATDSIILPSTASILGAPATGQITIVSTTGLSGLPATFTFSFTNYTGIAATSPTIVLNGQQIFTYGGNWASTDTIQHVAATFSAAVNARAGNIYTASVVSSTGVLVSLNVNGIYGNTYSVVSTSATDTGSGTFAGGADPVFVTINNGQQSLIYTYGGNWVSSDTVNHAAATLATIITASGSVDLAVANAPANIVYASTTFNSPLGNAFTMATSSASRVSVSSTNFSGGLNDILLGASFKLGANSYFNGKHWSDVSGTCIGTAASITAFINSISTNGAVAGGGVENVIATQSGCTVNLVTATSGVANNAIGLSASPVGSLTFGSPLFIGGQDNASITINGTTLTLGKDFPAPTASSTTANMASAIATAIGANTVLNKIITAQAGGSVITSTSIFTGAASNYATVSSTQSQLSFANPTMTGGKNAAANITTGVINLPAHGFTKALPLLYTSGGTTIGGLTTLTTYYAIVVDSNDIQLGSSSANAQAGTFITFTSSTTQLVAHTATLAPIAYTQGSAGGAWQVSNDCVNGPWVTFSTTLGGVTVSSQSYTAAAPATSIQDWGAVDFGCVRYNVTGPTWGGVQLKVILNAKD